MYVSVSISNFLATLFNSKVTHLTEKTIWLRNTHIVNSDDSSAVNWQPLHRADKFVVHARVIGAIAAHRRAHVEKL